MNRKAPKGAIPSASGCFVYCYLRTKSNKPYYVGLGTRSDRVTARHSCKVPTDRSRIRILRQGLTREQANYWESFYIARFGRKVDGGMLLNTREGGDGGAHDAQTNARIAAKVRERHLEGAFAALNGRDAIDRRRVARAANKAAEFGIPVDTYLEMSMSRRCQVKAWLKANPGKTFTDCPIGSMDDRLRRTADRLQIPFELWQSWTPTEKNKVLMWCRGNPSKTGADYLAGERSKLGRKPKLDKAEVNRLRGQGMSQSAIARQLGCCPSTICRILGGRRQRAG